MKNIANKLATGAIIIGIAAEAILSGGCSREYVGNVDAVKATSYNDAAKYKESDLTLGKDRYVIRSHKGTIWGVDFDETQLNVTTKDRLWDFDKDFQFLPINEVVSVGKFNQSRRFQRDRSKTLTEKDYKYNLLKYLTPVEIGGDKYLSKKIGNQIMLFKQGTFDVILDEKTNEIYLVNKKGQKGMYSATIPAESTYQVPAKENNSTKKQPSVDKGSNSKGKKTVTVNKNDTFWDYAKRYGITIKELKRLNPGVDPNKLRIGTRVRVK